jgi:chaperonin cofactor prefoldin
MSEETNSKMLKRLEKQHERLVRRGRLLEKRSAKILEKINALRDPVPPPLFHRQTFDA